jgi:hypothetical protein
MLWAAHSMRSWREPTGADLNHSIISSLVIFAIPWAFLCPWVAACRKTVHWFSHRREYERSHPLDAQYDAAQAYIRSQAHAQ